MFVDPSTKSGKGLTALEVVLLSAEVDSNWAEVGKSTVESALAVLGVGEEIVTVGRFSGSSSANHHLRHLLTTDLSYEYKLRA